MKKSILSVITAAIVLIFTVTVYAEISVPNNVEPVQADAENPITITVDSTAAFGGKSALPGDSRLRDNNPGAPLKTLDRSEISFYVSCSGATAGEYKLSDMTADYFGSTDRKFSISVNDVDAFGSGLKPSGSIALGKIDRGKIKLSEGINKITYKEDTEKSWYWAVISSITLEAVNMYPSIEDIGTSVEKPYVGDKFTLYANVGDDIGLDSVICKTEDAELPMTLNSDGMYSVELSLQNKGENEITIIATDSANLSVSKSYKIICIDFKTENVSISCDTTEGINKYTGSLVLRNGSSGSMQCCLIIAVYDDTNKLVGFGKNNINAESGDNNISVSVDVPSDDEYSVELMLWDNLWDMNELMNPKYEL